MWNELITRAKIKLTYSTIMCTKNFRRLKKCSENQIQKCIWGKDGEGGWCIIRQIASDYKWILIK